MGCEVLSLDRSVIPDTLTIKLTLSAPTHGYSGKIKGTHVMSAKWLDNLKVSKKLGLGFAAILLGVLTVTVIGYSSTNLLIERMGKSSKVAE
ncbi:methyl-accepting chemotaxis protein, partial [Pseudomonas syringae]|nr:methyl-accepting chemotaxis protein [Pseudomonas syringae]